MFTFSILHHKEEIKIQPGRDRFVDKTLQSYRVAKVQMHSESIEQLAHK